MHEASTKKKICSISRVKIVNPTANIGQRVQTLILNKSTLLKFRYSGFVLFYSIRHKIESLVQSLVVWSKSHNIFSTCVTWYFPFGKNRAKYKLRKTSFWNQLLCSIPFNQFAVERKYELCTHVLCVDCLFAAWRSWKCTFREKQHVGGRNNGLTEASVRSHYRHQHEHAISFKFNIHSFINSHRM